MLPELLLWITLGQLGVSLEALGRLWGSLSARLGYLWELLGGSVGHFKSAWGAVGPLLAKLEIWASEGDPTAGQWLSSTAPAHKIKPPGIHSADLRFPLKWWHEVLFGAPLPHAPGVRMT